MLATQLNWLDVNQVCIFFPLQKVIELRGFWDLEERESREIVYLSGTTSKINAKVIKSLGTATFHFGKIDFKK